MLSSIQPRKSYVGILIYNYHNSKNKFFIINPGELKNSIDDILSNYGNHFKGNLPFENQENKYTEKTLGKLISPYTINFYILA